MAEECDGTLSVHEELEALRSIYIDELQINVDEEGSCDSVALWLHPATADKVEEQYVRIYLIIKLPSNYPDDIPEVCIRNPRGLSDEQINRIIEELLHIAENSRGGAMLFELIEAAKELLTTENRPNEDCAICLYGFHEEDVFIKTECYHYFHSHCLNRYVKSKLVDVNSDSACGSNDEPLCPVCRVSITFTGDDKEYPEPRAVAAASISMDRSYKLQPDMEKLYQKQLSQGGIIDVEAEKNKFLLEIANVPTTEPKEIGKCNGETPVNSSCDVLENGNNKHNKSPTNSPSFKNTSSSNKNQSQGGYRQPYHKRFDQNIGPRGRKFAPRNRYQTGRSHFKASQDAEFDQTTPQGSVISEGSPVHESHWNHNQETGNSNSENSGVSHSNRSRTNRDYKNQGSQGYRPRQNYRGEPWKTGKRGDGRRAYNYSSHNPKSFNDVAAEKFTKEKCSEDGLVEESNELSEVNFEPDSKTNSHSGPRFSGGRNNQPRFQKYHENRSHYGKELSGREESSFGYSRPYRHHYQNTHRPESFPSYNSHNTERKFSSYNRSHQPNSPKYRGRNRGRWNGNANTNFNSKNVTKIQASVEENIECESVRQDLSEVGISYKSSGSSNSVKVELCSTKLPEEYGNSHESSTVAVRPPPGFANPLKKVVYGLPSLNPPPGFSQS